MLGPFDDHLIWMGRKTWKSVVFHLSRNNLVSPPSSYIIQRLPWPIFSSQYNLQKDLRMLRCLCLRGVEGRPPKTAQNKKTQNSCKLFGDVKYRRTGDRVHLLNIHGIQVSNGRNWFEHEGALCVKCSCDGRLFQVKDLARNNRSSNGYAATWRYVCAPPPHSTIPSYIFQWVRPTFVSPPSQLIATARPKEISRNQMQTTEVTPLYSP